MSGTLEVRQVEPVRQEEPWIFGVLLLTGSNGPSAGVQFATRAKGVARSATAWKRAELLGRLRYYDASAGAAVGPGVAPGSTTWVVGLSRPDPLNVAFGTADTFGVGAGVTAGGGTGYIRDDDSVVQKDLVELRKVKMIDIAEAYQMHTQSAFESGIATLTGAGRDAVGWFAAVELAALRDKGSVLRLIGSADRVDVEWYNDSLSKMRAKNVHQALRDALGHDLRAKVEVRGFGESLPKAIGVKNGQDDPKFRRVFIELDGRAVGSLRVLEK